MTIADHHAMHDPAMPSDPKAAVPSRNVDAGFPRIAGYRIQKRLGRGGMATVYLATQESLDRPVSIKVMEGDALADEVGKQRFENEARTIARLSHPNIVAIYEVGRTDDGRLYYVMPYLASGDLSQRDLREDETRLADVLRSLLSALGFAHARGIVHRDVKRENVLFDADDRPMLADFGIALSKSDDARITTAGLAVGSSGYMAPEQARGDVVDGRADLYSVGVLAYELLTGELPYNAADALALALMHVQDPIPRLPPGKHHWQSFIDRAMAKTRDARYQNAQEMAQAIDPIDRRSGTQLSSRVLRTLDRTVDGGRWKRLFALAAGAAVLVAGGLFVRDHLTSQAGTPAPAVATSPATPPASSAHEASAASSVATAQASPANSASSPADASSSTSTNQDASSSTKPATHTHHAPVRRRRPKENAFSRWWHRL